MAGLLDFAKSPAGQGLLAAGFAGLAGANRNTPINNIGRAGLAGLTGYSAAGAIDEQRQKREQAEKIKAAIPGLYGDDGKFDHRGYLTLGGTAAEAKALTELSGLGAQEAWKTVEVPGADGSMQVITLDKSGQRIGGGFTGYVAPQLVDTGDTKQFVTPQAGNSYGMGMSPAQVDASVLGRANLGLRAEANGNSAQANIIARENNQILGDLKVQEMEYKVDGLRADQDAKARERELALSALDSQLGVVDKAIDHPGREIVTGLSGSLDPRNYYNGNKATDFRVVSDQLQGAAFLQAFESLKGGGSITKIEGDKATAAIARLDTAQSDGEYLTALEELKGVITRSRAALAGGPATPPPNNKNPAYEDLGKEARYRRYLEENPGSAQ
jgi:hypothetical protein